MPDEETEVQETTEVSEPSAEEVSPEEEAEPEEVDEDALFDEATDETAVAEKEEEPETEEPEPEEPPKEVAEEKEPEPEKAEPEVAKEKSAKELAEEAGARRRDEVRDEPAPVRGEPEPPPKVEPKAEVPEVKPQDLPEADWGEELNEHFEEYKVEGRVAKRAFSESVKAGRDYTNTLGNYTLENFKKMGEQLKTQSELIDKLNNEHAQTRFWQDVMLDGEPDIRRTVNSAGFKDWLGKQSENTQLLHNSPHSKDAVKLVTFYRMDTAKEVVKKHDEEKGAAKKHMGKILKHTVTPTTRSGGTKKIDVDDEDAAWDEATAGS
ncbi:MAG: hypothetical protein GY853_13320 [PVC group bacterium]|nr:hypothetical protein [PVC group bacterium]